MACHEVLKLSLTLNEPKQVALQSILNTTSEHAPQVDHKHNNQLRIKGDQLPMISPIAVHVISDSFATLIHMQLNSAAPQKLFPRFEQQSMQI